MSNPVSPHSHRSLLPSLCFILEALIFVQWYLILVLVCIFLMVNHVVYLFMCLFSLPTPYPLWWSVFHVFVHFLIELYFYCCVLRVFIFSTYKSFVRYVGCKYFSQFRACFFHPLNTIFYIFNLMKSNFLIFFYGSCSWWDVQKVFTKY